MKHAFLEYDIFEQQIQSINRYVGKENEEEVRTYIHNLMERVRKCIESRIECNDRCVGQDIHVSAIRFHDCPEMPTTELIVRACVNEIRRCTGLHVVTTVIDNDLIVIKYSLNVPTLAETLKGVV